MTARILVRVEGLDKWLGSEDRINSVILYLDDRPLASVKAEPTGPADGTVRTLAFDLRRNGDAPQELEAWRRILISARRASPNSVHLSVGLPDRGPIASEVQLYLKRAKAGYEALVWVGLVLAISAVVLLAWRTELLRDAGPVPKGGGKRTFSLGRTQMAIWFCLVLVGWVYISLITMSAASVSGSILILLGISAGIGLIAVEIDSQKTSDCGPSKGWLKDILSDENGISFHRLQMFIWTLALGVYFTVSVFKDLLMPEFDSQLLILMGISSGTYLGFKLPEKSSTPLPSVRG